MKFKIDSQSFSFQHGNAILLDSEWEEHGIPQTATVRESPLLDNTFDWDIRAPGTFHLLLYKPMVTRVVDGQRFVIPKFVHPAVVTVTDEDVRQGTCTVPNEIEAVFRITVNKEATPTDKVTVFLSTGVTLNLPVDKHGQTLYLGKLSDMESQHLSQDVPYSMQVI